MRMTGLCCLLIGLGTAGGAQNAGGQVGTTADLGSRQPDGKTTIHGSHYRVPDIAATGLTVLVIGETIGDAMPIATLPFSDAGETCDNLDDYDAACDYVSTSPDIVYSFTPTTNMHLDIDLCGSGFDTKVYVLDANLNLLACNEDFYPPNDPCGGYVSRLQGAPVVGGQTVYIVVDGYSGTCGTYQINVAELIPCVLTCAGDIIESEPTLRANYIDRFNSGCNGPNVVPPIITLQADESGELSYCGVSGFYVDTANNRDTDWFAITLGSTGVATWTLNAEQVTMGFVLALACPDPDVYGVVTGGPCASGTVEIIGTPGANVGLWIGPPGYTAPLGMIGTEYDYEFTLTGLSSHRAVAVEPVKWGTMKSFYR